MLVAPKVAHLTEVPSDEIILYFKNEIKTHFPHFTGTLTEESIELSNTTWKLSADTLARLKREYIVALGQHKEKLAAQGAMIPGLLRRAQEQLAALPLPDATAHKTALQSRKDLSEKKARVKDWKKDDIKMTAEHQRSLLQKEIDACQAIIDDCESRRRARSAHIREIENLKTDEKKIQDELSGLSDISRLADDFISFCVQLSREIPQETSHQEDITTVQVETATAVDVLVPRTKKPLQWPRWLTPRAAIFGLLGGVAVLGGSWAMKKYDAEQRRVLEWKTSLLRDYFDPEKLGSIPESAVHDYSSIGAQLKDGNRNHNWNLSDEEIRHLVQLGDPLKVYIAEPRFEWGNPGISDKIQKRWDTFFAQNRTELMRLFSEEKFADIVSLMREKDDVFALIPNSAQAYIASGEVGVVFHITGEKNLCLDFVIGDELIPEGMQPVAVKIKSDIESGKIGIKDIGIVEKYGGFIDYLSGVIGIDRSKFVVMASPLIGGEFLKITIQNTGENSPNNRQHTQAIINTGKSLRHFAQKEDPEGIEIMANANRTNNLPTYIHIMLIEGINRVLEQKSQELIPELQKIQANFPNPHHEFPTVFLNHLEGYINEEIKRGPLGVNFGKENITILCNAIGPSGVQVHAYICRADKVFFSGNAVMSADGAYPAGMYVQERKALENTIHTTLIQSPGGDFSQIVQKIPNGTIRIQPGSVHVMALPFGAPGANFGAILQYVGMYSESPNRYMVENFSLPKFGLEIGSSLSLPRGLESKVFFHPLEIQAIQEAFMKVPGLAGYPVTVNSILHEGKKRAVATVVTNNNQKIDIILPEAEKTAINTTMTSEHQEIIKQCISQSTADFSKHGAILKLGNDLTSKISEGLRTKLTELKVKPGFVNGEYMIGIRVKLIDGTYYETSISAVEVSKMIEAYLTGMIEKEKVLSQVDYLVKLNGASNYQERVQNIGDIALLQSKIPEPTYHIDLVRSGMTVNAAGEPILRVIFMIEGHPTVFGFELAAKGHYKN